jgi:ABC-2 type transport system permease protein
VIVGEILVQAMNSGKWLFWLFSVHLNLLNNWTGKLSADLNVNLSLGTGLTVLGIWVALALIPAFVTFTRRDVLNA